MRRIREGVCEPGGARPRGVRGWRSGIEGELLPSVARRLESSDAELDTARDSASDIPQDAAR